MANNIEDYKLLKTKLEVCKVLWGATSVITAGSSALITDKISELFQKRLRELDEAIVQSLHDGKIHENSFIEEDRLVSFIFRARRAAIEGAGKTKLKLIADYFFDHAFDADYEEAKINEFTDITAMLTRSQIKIIALLKKNLQNKDFNKAGMTSDEQFEKYFRECYSSIEDLSDALNTLIRFGFVRPLSTFGRIGFALTSFGEEYIFSLNLTSEQPN